MNSNARFKSQEIIRVLLEKVFNEDHYDQCLYAEEMLIRNLIKDVSQLNKEELHKELMLLNGEYSRIYHIQADKYQLEI
jgi:hypothetical protein